LSPDGKRLAVLIDSPERQSDVWVYDLERGTRSRLTTNSHYVMPVWTPDGTRVVFSGGRLFSRAADGSGSIELLLDTPARFPTSFSPDGRTLLMNVTDSPSPDVWALPIGDAASARPLLNGSSQEWFGQFSPDSRFIAYMSNETGRSEVYVVSYPDLRGRVVVSTDGGSFPMWSRDGRELFYRQNTDAVMAVSVDTSGEFRAGRPRLLFKGPYAAAGGDRTFDVAPDGRFLLIRSDEAASGRQLNLVTNWFDELDRLAPVQQPTQ
jgi:Tol biopolymer transport system component